MNADSTSSEGFARSTAVTAPVDRRTAITLAAWGVVVWFAVAVSIRLVGHVVLDPASGHLVVGFFVAVVPLMALVTYPVYRWLDVPRSRRPAAAAVMSIPGMVLDVLLVGHAATVFPAMSTAAVVNFGGILLFGYAVVLLTGFVHPAPIDAGRVRTLVLSPRD
jgi:hypothetical protein